MWSTAEENGKDYDLTGGSTCVVSSEKSRTRTVFKNPRMCPICSIPSDSFMMLAKVDCAFDESFSLPKRFLIMYGLWPETVKTRQF